LCVGLTHEQIKLFHGRAIIGAASTYMRYVRCVYIVVDGVLLVVVLVLVMLMLVMLVLLVHCKQSRPTVTDGVPNNNLSNLG
jgi:hypothetical protein